MAEKRDHLKKSPLRWKQVDSVSRQHIFPDSDPSRISEKTRDPLRSGATTMYASVTWYRIRLRLDIEYRIRGNSAAQLGYYPEQLLVCLHSLTPDFPCPTHPSLLSQIDSQIPSFFTSLQHPLNFSKLLNIRQYCEYCYLSVLFYYLLIL